MLLDVSVEIAQVPIDRRIMKVHIEIRITARILAKTVSGRQVTIDEVTEFQHFTMLDGTPKTVEGAKKYQINAREPVNLENSTFSLAATGEKLIPL